MKQKSVIQSHYLSRQYEFFFHFVIYLKINLHIPFHSALFHLGPLVQQKNVIIQETAIEVKSRDEHEISVESQESIEQRNSKQGVNLRKKTPRINHILINVLFESNLHYAPSCISRQFKKNPMLFICSGSLFSPASLTFSAPNFHERYVFYTPSPMIQQKTASK